MTARYAHAFVTGQCNNTPHPNPHPVSVCLSLPLFP